MNTFDAYSTLNSSPWTAESFGGNPEKARACREYVWHAIAVSSFYGLASAAIGESVGDLLTNDDRRDAMRQRAYAASRPMTWRRTGDRYLAVFGEVQGRWASP